jgi:O-succinylbenzoate synthase
MIVESACIRLISMPMTRPFRTSTGTMAQKMGVIVELRTADGRSGFGEAAALQMPTYLEETAYSCYDVLLRTLAPTIVGQEMRSAQDFVARYRHVRGNRFARAGLESAYWDLLSQEWNAPLCDLLGGVRTHIEVGESLGIKDTIPELLKEVEQRLEEGYKRIKVKIEPGWDLEPIAAVRAAFPTIPLMVDANSSYRLSDGPLLRKLDQFDLLMIEQPLGHDDIVDHAALQAQIATPICLDESIRSSEDARKALQLGSCRIINIKPGRVGGPLESKLIHDLCAAWNVRVWMGGSFETGIGRAFNIALAALPNFDLPADMSPPSMYFPEDLVEPSFTVDSGRIAVSRRPGLGYTVVEERLVHYTIASAEVRA